MMRALPPQPLNDAEFARLDEFLLSEAWPQDGMALPAIDGLFAALAAAPMAVPPSEFLPIIYGGGEPKFASPEEMEEILGLLLRHHGWVMAQVREPADPDDAYCPIVMELDEGEDVPAEARAYHERSFAADWAAGFLDGCDLVPEEAWAQVERDEPELLDGMETAVQLVDAWAGDKLGEPNPLPLEERREMLEEVVSMAEALADYFRYSPWPKREPVRKSAVPMRNDPCPCGSGKKYKKCCGDNTKRA